MEGAAISGDSPRLGMEAMPIEPAFLAAWFSWFRRWFNSMLVLNQLNQAVFSQGDKTAKE